MQASAASLLSRFEQPEQRFISDDTELCMAWFSCCGLIVHIHYWDVDLFSACLRRDAEVLLAAVLSGACCDVILQYDLCELAPVSPAAVVLASAENGLRVRLWSSVCMPTSAARLDMIVGAFEPSWQVDVPVRTCAVQLHCVK